MKCLLMKAKVLKCLKVSTTRTGITDAIADVITTLVTTEDTEDATEDVTDTLVLPRLTSKPSLTKISSSLRLKRSLTLLTRKKQFLRKNSRPTGTIDVTADATTTPITTDVTTDAIEDVTDILILLSRLV